MANVFINKELAKIDGEILNDFLGRFRSKVCIELTHAKLACLALKPVTFSLADSGWLSWCMCLESSSCPIFLVVFLCHMGFLS
jgi:hypothetical protein